MARIHPDKGYFEVATDEQNMEALRERWSGRHKLYNTSTRPCSRCEGKGYTRQTRTKVIRLRASGGYKTSELGSGCPVCFGTGRV